ncbi:hypothetical protein [Thiomicrospira microaerophila]|uniref:hypothetical protein n=1 Tax=Thiomicrospira microaerophila TaxID=406020 RepID=UPI0005C9C5DA|nr:hypothetical protein [Thiomicrospira microaerophila]
MKKTTPESRCRWAKKKAAMNNFKTPKERSSSTKQNAKAAQKETERKIETNAKQSVMKKTAPSQENENMGTCPGRPKTTRREKAKNPPLTGGCSEEVNAAGP